MKKVFIVSTLILLAFGGSISANASEKNDIRRLIELQPGVKESEVVKTINTISKQTRLSKDEVIATSIKELEAQAVLDRKETPMTRGGSSGAFLLSKSMNKGDIFYSPSSTMGIQHGHLGIYYSVDTIVESIPNSGVRKIAYNARNVEKNSIIQAVTTSQAKRNAAANWANSRVGEKYSYNFATNRVTSHTGDKNCSKLLWSAFKVKAKIDIDSNGGWGVYPKDIINSSWLRTYRTIK